jgi:hypothetical protein
MTTTLTVRERAPSPNQRRATGQWLNGVPGLVQSRKARTTGTVVGVYDSLAQGIESDPDLPWSTVCEDHGSVVSHHALRDALSWAAHSDGWCDDCRDALRARESGMGARAKAVLLSSVIVGAQGLMASFAAGHSYVVLDTTPVSPGGISNE